VKFFNIAVVMTLAISALPAYGGITGTFKGGFTSSKQSLSTELRCDANSICELESSETLNGQVLPQWPLAKGLLQPLGGCSTPPENEWANCDFTEWDAVRKAFKFAREHQNEQTIGMVKELLEPFLLSKAELSRCYIPQRNSVLCELDQPVSSRPAVLLFSVMMTPCYPLSGFCTYRVLPLFKESDHAVLKAMQVVPVKSPWTGPPPEQSRVAAYVTDLQGKIHKAMIVPSSAPIGAHVAYQVQFSQETGNVYSVNFMDGCYCPSLREAVGVAIRKLTPLPVLPPDMQSTLGNSKDGRVYLETTIGRD
jgi:hypothetical protein